MASMARPPFSDYLKYIYDLYTIYIDSYWFLVKYVYFKCIFGLWEQTVM